MNVEEIFDFLIKDYNFSYKYQKFVNCYEGNWIVQTYSFYNNSGCFTIHFLPQRNELDFYYSSRFSTEHKKLCERIVDICSIEPDIWNKYTKIWIFKRPFFWWNNNKVLYTFAEALKTHLDKSKDFFGIQIEDNTG